VARFVAFDPFAPAERAAQLGVELVSLGNLLDVSDYVLVNCPLTLDTRGLVGKAQLARMKRDAVLINTARGPVIDQAALIEALQSGQIAGAALDCVDRGAIPRYGTHGLHGRFSYLSRRGAAARRKS
jgi:D-3-phosphoglycerate dehydrogenase